MVQSIYATQTVNEYRTNSFVSTTLIRKIAQSQANRDYINRATSKKAMETLLKSVRACCCMLDEPKRRAIFFSQSTVPRCTTLLPPSNQNAEIIAGQARWLTQTRMAG
jgi:hypothetical protein